MTFSLSAARVHLARIAIERERGDLALNGKRRPLPAVVLIENGSDIITIMDAEGASSIRKPVYRTAVRP